MPARCRPSYHHLLPSRRCPPVTKDSVPSTSTPIPETCFRSNSTHTSWTSAAHMNGNSPTTHRSTGLFHLMTNQSSISSVHPLRHPQLPPRHVRGPTSLTVHLDHCRSPDTFPHPPEEHRWTGPHRYLDRDSRSLIQCSSVAVCVSDNERNGTRKRTRDGMELGLIM